MDCDEVLDFWRSVMLNDALDVKERLKASEYLAKSDGLFDGKEPDGGGDMTIRLEYG